MINSQISSSFIREQKRYSLHQLRSIFDCTEEKTVSIIRILKEYGVLKTVKSTDQQKDLSDLSDNDIIIADVESNYNEYLYVFTFVGVIVVSGCVLKCYPKYLPDNIQPLNELKQILKVLEKYFNKEQVIRMFNESSESCQFNHLAVMLFLMYDFFENGTYTNTEDIIEYNGSGEILWDKTINETFTLISHNRPYYPDLLTKRRVTNDYDYFKRLHESIITNVSRDLRNADLLELFEITGVDLTDEEMDEFGDKEYILYRIEKELNCQFNTRKQLLLKAIYAYIDLSGNLYDTDSFSLFGTNSFNLVWENVCAEILDNQLQKPLYSLKLPEPVPYDCPEANKKLIELIEKPEWTYTNTRAEDTLIPDLITIYGNKFIIFDAKYYTPVLERGKTPKGQPGIESITKQYLYQLAYNNFTSRHGLSKENIRNCFLMPTAMQRIVSKGSVKMKMFADLGLQDIEVRLIPATMAYKYYLSGEKINVSELGLYENTLPNKT